MSHSGCPLGKDVSVTCDECGVTHEYTPKLPESLPKGYSCRDGAVENLCYGDKLLAWFTFGGDLELTSEGMCVGHREALALFLQGAR